MASRRRPEVQRRGVPGPRANPIYESPVGRGAVEKTWNEVRQAIVNTRGKSPTCAVEIRSIDTWTFEVTVWFAEYDEEVTDLQQRFEDVRERAFAVVRDGEYKYVISNEDTEDREGSIDDVIYDIDTNLELLGLSKHAESVALIDGVYVDWSEAIRMAEEGRTIVLHSARTAFADTWADAVEQAGRTQELIGQGNVFDLAPPMNNEAIRWAQEMWFRVCRENRGRKIPDTTAKEKRRMGDLEARGITGTIPTWGAGACLNYVEMGALEGPVESGRTLLINDFAFTTAMQALGTGVAWTDNYPEHGLKIPHFPANFIIEVPAIRRIRITYEIITPESAEDGDAERGWENEEGVVMEADEDDIAEAGVYASGETRAYADAAVDFLENAGVTEYSSSPGTGDDGGWYTEYGDQDMHTGNYENHSYHLEGFTDEELRDIYNRLFEHEQENTFARLLAQKDPEGREMLRAFLAASPGGEARRSALSKLVSHLNYAMAYTDESLEPVHEFFAELYQRTYGGEDDDTGDDAG